MAKESSRQRTQVAGQNPKANNSPEHDEPHDESRRNLYDPEVAASLRGSRQDSHGKKQ